MVKFYIKHYIWIWTGILIIAIAVIFLNGYKPGNESSVVSSRMASIIDRIIVKVTGTHERSLGQIELIIRKLAHFIQYFVLGTILYIATYGWFKGKWYRYLVFLLLGVPIPLIEEWIQLSAPGRTGHFLDVLIDLSGLIGALIIGSIYSFVEAVNRVKREYLEKNS